jgi:hypothetical protein
MEFVEVRKRIIESIASGVNIEIRPVINSKIESLERAGVEFESYRHAFSLGYITGMSNPTFEAVQESVRVIKLFGSLDDNGKRIIMLIMDGIKARYKDKETDNG